MAGDADTLLVGGRIFTATRERPWARALAIAGDRLVAVGTDRQAERWRGRRTRVVDLGGRVVVPGFIDAHAHLASLAGARGWVDLSRARSLEAAVERLRSAATKVPPGGWVVGTGWDEAKWPEGRVLSREDLDRVSRDRPVLARRIDAHMGSLNSRALERAAGCASERGFEVDALGRPTGVLREEAFAAALQLLTPTVSEIEAGLGAVTRMAHRLGITSLHDVVGADEWRAYQRLHRAGRLRLRVTAMPRDALLPHLEGAGMLSGLGDPWLRLGPVKVFADGSLGASTAALREPYADRPGDRGMLVHPRGGLEGLLGRAHRAGLQTATHAIGDQGIGEVLSALEDALACGPRRDLRHRIEHYELPDEDALVRTRKARVVVCAQPNFIGQWSAPGDLYERRLGRERASRNNPYREILRRSIPLAFGSDGMPYGPLYGIHWAVNGFFPDQRISVEEAIRASTAGGAFASFEEGIKGTLEEGKLADLVVLDGDPFTDPRRIQHIRVQATWLGGPPVYRRLSRA